MNGADWFAKLLRAAIYRKEENTVREMVSQSRHDKNHDFGSIVCSSVNEEGYTLVQNAVLSQSQVILDCLLAALPSGVIRLRAVQSSGNLANNYTPLHIAALKENVEAAVILLEQGADANAKSKVR